MSRESVTDYILALKTMLDVSSDEALAAGLNVGKSTIASWRRRGSVPKKTGDEIKRRFGVDWKELADPAHRKDALVDTLQKTAFFIAVFKLGRSLPEADLVDVAGRLAQYQHVVFDVLAQDFRNDEIIRAKPEAFTALILKVARGEHATPDQILSRLKEFEQYVAERQAS